jgi:hypothetical protein
VGTNLRKSKRPTHRIINDMSKTNVSNFLEGLAKSILDNEFPIDINNDPNECYDKLIDIITTNFNRFILKKKK